MKDVLCPHDAIRGEHCEDCKHRYPCFTGEARPVTFEEFNKVIETITGSSMMDFVNQVLKDNKGKRMIKTLKCATNMPEMLFLCREHGILPVLTESVFLGLTLARVLYEQHPDQKLALFDSNMLLEVVSYDDEAELLPYMKQREFEFGYKVDKDGKGIPID